MEDLIKRSDAIKATWQEPTYTDPLNVLTEVRDRIEAVPSADIPHSDDWERYSERLWKTAYERGKADRPQDWIPCSERLPEDIRPVLVTWKNTDPASYYQYIVGKHFIGTAHYCKGKWYWYSSATEDLLAEYGKCDSEEFDEAIEAVAWMPLPKPW